jgi:hypothetical protein
VSRVAAFSFVFLSAFSAPASAQDDADVQAAARAFQQGQEAQLRGDYGRAAELFELANNLAPSPQAVRSALRNHQAAGNRARAATLALTAQREHAGDADTMALASEILAEAQAALARVRVRCTPACGVVVDGRAVWTETATELEIFVEPGARSIRATWSSGRAETRALDLAAGQRAELELAEPSAPEEPPPVEPPPAEPPPVVAPPTPVDEDDGGLSPAFFWTGVALTAAMGGVYFWSLADTLSLRDDYEDDPTEARYRNGRDARTRSIALGTVALALAAGTAALGIFGTDWDGDGEESVARVRPDLRIGPGGAFASLVCSFGGDSL